MNNGIGTEFKNYWHPAAKFGKDTDPFMAATGHYGNKSPDLVKNYALSLGFQYLSAANKEEYLKGLDSFCNPNIGTKPVIFEAFTDSASESDALHIMHNLRSSPESAVKNTVKNLLGEKGIKAAKKLMGKG